MSRRSFIGVAGATGLFAITALRCGTAHGQPPGQVFISHPFGQTIIPAPPKRVLSAGFTEQDDLLAVGVEPVGVTNWWGDQQSAVWPWAQPKFAGAEPPVLNLDSGLQFDQIAALKPDLIVATNAGVNQDSYNRLSAIAPNV
jgi:iron complex transport system substrate-binding protein